MPRKKEQPKYVWRISNSINIEKTGLWESRQVIAKVDKRKRGMFLSEEMWVEVFWKTIDLFNVYYKNINVEVNQGLLTLLWFLSLKNTKEIFLYLYKYYM